MVRLLSILILLVAGRCFAAWPYDAVCEVQNGNAGGSGTLVGVKDDKGVVLSCGHIFDEGVRNPVARFGDKKYRGRVLGIDKELDLSAFVIQAPEGIKTPKCVRAAKRDDGFFIAVGYPWYSRGKEPHWTKGKYLGYSGKDVQFLARPYVHSGYSGGGLFAPDGSFVGVVCGYGEGYSYAPSGKALIEFASRWIKCE